jgi:4-cresol dehydrogenase (hydroxylating)
MNIQLFKQELVEIFSEIQCSFDEASIAPYLRSLTNASKRIIGIVKPITVEQIQQVLKLANKYQISVYSISQGNNWGYGEKIPVSFDNLIIDLSKMDAVTQYDDVLGYISLQPGVTQQQLHDFFQERGAKYMVPVTGAGVFGSILGNAIDRGYGITPYCDHFHAITEMKVLLADGQLIQTGLSRFGAIHSGPVFRWGIGPYQDGLYAQGNFGIVVEITILLKKIPETIKLVQLYDDAVIGSGISLFSGLRALSVASQFPYLLLDKNKKVNSAELLAQLMQEKGISPWMGVFAVYGKSKLVDYNIKEIKRILKPLTSKFHVFSQTSITRLKFLNRLLNSNKSAKALQSVQTILNIVSGIPMRDTLNQIFWRSRLELKITDATTANDITLHDNGLLWFSPIIPFSSEHFACIYNIIEPILKKYEFECMFGCAGFSSHCLDVTIPIFFNKHDVLETEKALACYDELFNQCLAAGYMPYRINSDKMYLLPDTPYDAINTKLKSAPDKNGILAPGRYVKEMQI